MKTCIIIPSHINNINRTKLLISCLESLINQTHPIPIYLSISFETELDKKLFYKVIKKTQLYDNLLIHIIYQKKQTSQFRHIDNIVLNIENNYDYVMFCDDDDRYENTRVEKFIIMIKYGINNCPKDKIFIGAYERDLQKGSHSSSFYEYWSYCVNIKFITNFMNTIKNNYYNHYIDHIMCDVLFSTYLRCLNEKHYFVSINEKLYNYNKNEYSITNKIKLCNIETNNIIKKHEPDFKRYIKNLNNFLEENMEVIKQNIFLYSTCNSSFEDILKQQLKENYKYKNKINKNILQEIKCEYDNIKNLCECLYQQKILF